MTEDAMKSRWAVVAALLTAGRGIAQDERPSLRINLHHGPRVEAVEVCRAKLIAARILADAGVRVEWAGGTRPAAPPVEMIEIQLDDAAPVNQVTNEALGYALINQTAGVRVHIFLDRISAVDKKHSGMALGHVLAYEIGHVLEGAARHSETGVLKANFDAGDMKAMAKAPLRFAPADVALIQAHFPARAHTD
jgi:hypothetical protein